MTEIENGQASLACSRDARGVLYYYEGTAPFGVRRVFWVTDVPPGQERGHHAHRTCTELVVAVCGSFAVELTDSEGVRTIVLDNPGTGLLIPPMCWCRLYEFSADAVLLCLADSPYSREGYINDFEAFKREVQNGKNRNP